MWLCNTCTPDVFSSSHSPSLKWTLRLSFDRENKGSNLLKQNCLFYFSDKTLSKLFFFLLNIFNMRNGWQELANNSISIKYKVCRVSKGEDKTLWFPIWHPCHSGPIRFHTVSASPTLTWESKTCFSKTEMRYCLDFKEVRLITTNSRIRIILSLFSSVISILCTLVEQKNWDKCTDVHCFIYFCLNCTKSPQGPNLVLSEMPLKNSPAWKTFTYRSLLTKRDFSSAPTEGCITHAQLCPSQVTPPNLIAK